MPRRTNGPFGAPTVVDGRSAVKGSRASSPVRTLATRLLDLALPATCPGCGREGEPVCAGLRAGTVGPPGSAGRGDDRVAGRAARSARPARVVRPVQRDRPGRPPCPEVRRRAPPGGAARGGRRRALAAGRRRRRPGGAGAHPRVAGAGARVRPGRPPRRRRRRAAGPADASGPGATAPDDGPVRAGPGPTRSGTSPAPSVFGRRRAAAVIDPEPVRGRWVILVDDVTTTGSTLAACAAALMAEGALAVSGLTIARER